MLPGVWQPSFSFLHILTLLPPYLSEELATADCLPAVNAQQVSHVFIFSGTPALGFVTMEKAGQHRQEEAEDFGNKQLAQTWYYNTDEPNKNLETIERYAFLSFLPVSFTSHPCFPHLLCSCCSMLPAHSLLPFFHHQFRLV